MWQMCEIFATVIWQVTFFYQNIPAASFIFEYDFLISGIKLKFSAQDIYYLLSLKTGSGQPKIIGKLSFI